MGYALPLSTLAAPTVAWDRICDQRSTPRCQPFCPVAGMSHQSLDPGFLREGHEPREGGWQAQEPRNPCHLCSKTKWKTLPRWWFCCVLPFTSQWRTAQPLGIGAQNLHSHLPWGSQRPDNLSPEQEVAGSSNWEEEGTWRTERPAETLSLPPAAPGVGPNGQPLLCLQTEADLPAATSHRRSGGNVQGSSPR